MHSLTFTALKFAALNCKCKILLEKLCDLFLRNLVQISACHGHLKPPNSARGGLGIDGNCELQRCIDPSFEMFAISSKHKTSGALNFGLQSIHGKVKL